MKKFFKYIFTALMALSLNAKTSKAADNISIPSGWTPSPEGTTAWVYTKNHEQYFTWGNGRGTVMYSGKDATDKGHVIVHCKRGVDDKYRFFCDEACTVECIGLGNNSEWEIHAGWYPIIDTDIPQIALQGRNFSYSGDGKMGVTFYDVPFSTYRNFGGTIGIKWHDTGNIDRYKTYFHSPHDISQFLHMLCNACLHLDGVSHSSLRVYIFMHDEYEITKNEWCANISAIFEGKPVYVVNYSSPYPSLKWTYNADLDQFSSSTVTGTFPHRIEIIRASDYIGGGSMLTISPDYEGGKDGTDTYYLNYSPGNETFGNRFVIDNATTSDDDIAINVHHNGLLMLSHSLLSNRVGRKGIGVKLASGGDHNYHNSAVELGSDIGDPGTCKIQNCHVAIDADAGVIRLKKAHATEFQIHDNDIVANIAHDVLLGKWSYDISSFTNHNVLITLKNTEDWHSGDIVFASGRTTVSGGTESQYPGQYLCLLTPSEDNHITYADETDLSKTYNIVFVSSGVPKNEDYEYPCFVLDVPCIYNSRTKQWYPFLQKALTDVSYPIQNGDQLIYFGSVTEPQSCTISNSITIRSACLDNELDVQAQVASGRDPIDPNGYTSTYSNNSSSFISVTNGATITFGTNSSIADGHGQSGRFTIDLKNLGRAVDITNGTVNANANFKITNGKESANGGAIKIGANGTLNLTDAEIYGNNAGNSGCSIYQGGTMNVSGSPTFGSSDYVYLPEGKVITKVGAFTPTATVPVKLQNEVNGRDILVSNPGVSSTDPGVVSSEDQGKLNVVLATVNRFSVAYNASGLNGGGSPANVIELQEGKGDILIKKTGLKASDSVEFTVCLAGSSTPVYTVVLSGINDSGSEVSVTIKELPVGSYTVTETEWSWTYSCTAPSVTHDVIPDTCTVFAFVNTEDTTKPDHAESNKNNVFN